MMINAKNLGIAILAIILLSCNGNKALYNSKIDQQQLCEEKGGYWYKGKCWMGFEEEGIAKEDIDQVVVDEMKLINSATISINNKEYPIKLFMPEMEGKEVLFITIFEDETGEKTIIQQAQTKSVKKGGFTAPAMMLDLNIMELEEGGESQDTIFNQPFARGVLTAEVQNFDSLNIHFSGSFKSTNSGKTYNVKYQSNEAILGAGTSTLVVKDNVFYLNGELGTRTYSQLKNAIKAYPNIKTIVLGQINGSLNDEVNMHTGRILREAGLTTKVLKDSNIASGGVDLFCAGKERIVEKGAKLGIHSWCCYNDLTAVELPKDHPAHQYQLEFFTMCLGSEKGPDFYFHTLTSAPFDGVHWMSDEEIVEWTVATKFVE